MQHGERIRLKKMLLLEISGLYFLNPDVCMLKNWVFFMLLDVLYFFNKKILKPHVKIIMCI